MSFLFRLSENLEKVIEHIAKYETAIAEAEELFNMEGKKLEYLCRVLPANIVRYDEYHNELKSLEDYLKAKRDVIESKLWKKYVEGYSRALSTRDIQAYIQGDAEYVSYTELILEVVHVKTQIKSIVEAFGQMGWMLSHVTKLRVAEMQDAIL
jgi:hypothetical protein